MSIRLPALTFREWDGPLTSDLVREPARFGLGQVPKLAKPESVATAICGFCSTGCGLKVHMKEGKAVNLSPDERYPVNIGMACPKGWEALTVLDAEDRATTPLLDGKPIQWDEALSTFCSRMKAVMQQHGRESVAFISTGQMMVEEMAYLGAVAKFGMGILHGDGNTRQCMATSVMAYKESFGFDAPPFTYADFEQSDVLVFVGANPCIAHPIMWQRVLRNQRNPKIIVIDPRRTETAAAATQHCAIKPKSDLALLYGIARGIIQAGGVDEAFVSAHVNGFEGFSAFLEQWTTERVCDETGLQPAELQQVVDAIVSGTPRVSFWWTMGVNQGHQATRTAQAIINLALMTGNIGKPGTGANSITGQCNAMGSRLFSNTTNLLGGHDFRNASHRQKVAAATGIPAEQIPDQPSLAYDQILTGVEEGRIKALWIIATNPAHSWIQQGRFHELVKKLDLLVVQDMYPTTQTAKAAHLFLPAAAWGEKEGTFINSERRIGVSRKVKTPPGQALPDFDIFRLIAHYWGCNEWFKEWTTPESVFGVLQRCSQGQPCDITGIHGYAMLEEAGGVQWPLRPGETAERERRLFSDGAFFTPDGCATMFWEAPAPVPEPADVDYPLVLLTGRGSSAQWHTETRTAKSAILRKLAPAELWVALNPADAAMLKVRDGQTVDVVSRRGRVPAVARLMGTMQQGTIFLPMHDERINQLTLQIVDPISRQPSYKHCAVKVVPS
jgi:anaerobic selenocysteine-containing dehydrogenase